MGIDFSDPWIQLAAAGAGGPAGAAIFSMFQSKDANDKIMKLIDQATDQYGNLNVPKLQDLMRQQGSTLFDTIKDDPQYRAQQQAADANLSDIINGGGMTLSDRAALQGIRDRANLDTTARNNQILQGMAARGTLDSGATEAAQLANNQAATQNENAAGMNIFGQAQQRALQAIQQRGSNASNELAREQQLAEARSAAQDAINKSNVDVANMAHELDFQNQMNLANAKSGALMRQAGAIGAQSQGENAAVGSLANVGPTMFNQVLSWMHGSPGPQAQTPQAPSSPTGSTSQPLSGNTTNYGGGSGGLGDFPIGTGSGTASTAQAASGEGTKPSATPDQNGDYVLAGYDVSGTPIYHRRAAGSGGQNF